jgi:hypothetical protein
VLDAGCGPANDLRLLRDAGVHPVGVDLSAGALHEARMLLAAAPAGPRTAARAAVPAALVRGLWLSGTFTHLPRGAWRSTFAGLLELLERGPVYLACYRGTADLERLDDPVLGEVYVSAATEAEVEALLTSHGCRDLTVEVRPTRSTTVAGRGWSPSALGTLDR